MNILNISGAIVVQVVGAILLSGIKFLGVQIPFVIGFIEQDENVKKKIALYILSVLTIALRFSWLSSIRFGISVIDGRFEIDLNGLTGKQELKFTNDQNEEAIFTYYVADENGLVKDYMLENEQAYVKTVENAKVVYTTKDAKKIDYVAELIAKMPEVTKTNLKEITLLPTEHASRAAGITDYNKVTLYNLSTYTDKEIQRIVTHEIAHTWAHELRKAKVIDYSYTNFGSAVKADGNVVTDYSKNSLSEDFADSIALYLANADSFTKNFPARSNYIANLF